MEFESHPVLDKGYVTILDMMGNDATICSAARVSRMGTPDTSRDAKLIDYLMQHNHTSPFEMVEFQFEVKCPIFVARQWMRHRTWSYNEVSRRYTSEDIDFYTPEFWRGQDEINKQSSTDDYYTHGEYALKIYQDLLDQAKATYYHLLADGVAREQARMVLPLATYTTFIAKVDAHNLMHFLHLRMGQDAQEEIRVYANVIYEHFFKPNLPLTAAAFEKYILGVSRE